MVCMMPFLYHARLFNSHSPYITLPFCSRGSLLQKSVHEMHKPLMEVVDSSSMYISIEAAHRHTTALAVPFALGDCV